MQFLNAGREGGNQPLRAGGIDGGKLAAQVGIHIEAAVPHRGKGECEVLSTLNARVPVGEREEQNVALGGRRVQTVGSRLPGQRKIERCGGVVPAIPKVSGAVLRL